MEMFAKIGSQIACIHAWLTSSSDLETLKEKTHWNETKKSHLQNFNLFSLYLIYILYIFIGI